MIIEINLVKWFLDILVILLAIIFADKCLSLYKNYLDWKIKKLKEKQNDKR